MQSPDKLQETSTSGGVKIIGTSNWRDPFNMRLEAPGGAYLARIVQETSQADIRIFALTTAAKELVLVGEVDKIFDRYNLTDSAGNSAGTCVIDWFRCQADISGHTITIPFFRSRTTATIGNHKCAIKYRYYLNPRLELTLPEALVRSSIFHQVLALAYLCWCYRWPSGAS